MSCTGICMEHVIFQVIFLMRNEKSNSLSFSLQTFEQQWGKNYVMSQWKHATWKATVLQIICYRCVYWSWATDKNSMSSILKLQLILLNCRILTDDKPKHKHCNYYTKAHQIVGIEEVWPTPANFHLPSPSPPLTHAAAALASLSIVSICIHLKPGKEWNKQE